MESQFDLTVENVSKRYWIGQQESAGARLRQIFGRSKASEFWAIRDINFQVRPGESVGIIGHNGAGKSTMLKMLSGITTPTTGQIRIRGRLTALLEVGSGFHPELTGRENVFLSGSILGMTRREIHNKLEEIIEFAGVRDFIDIPVKRFSSGMYVRLGFSIAAHLTPDVLLLDEVLAVGDIAFQQKCVQRILDMRRQGTTVLFISHDLQAVERVCTRTLVFDHGKVLFDGDTKDAIALYNRAAKFTSAHRKAVGDAVRVSAVEFYENGAAEPVSHVCTGSAIRARIVLQCNTPVDKTYADLYVVGPDNGTECTLTTRERMVDFAPGHYFIDFELPELVPRPDLYRIDVIIASETSADALEWLVGCAMLQVNAGSYIGGGEFHQPHRWSIRQVPESELVTQQNSSSPAR